MASILSLPDDCLGKIVSCIEDQSSFYSIALTCKRLLQVTNNTRSVMHTNLLRAKAEYFIKCYIVCGSIRSFTRLNFGKLNMKLSDLLRDFTRLTAAKGILTYDKVIDVWQRNGAVAAKLFTWMRNQESTTDDATTSSTKIQSVTLHLPSCGKSMEIKTSYVVDYDFKTKQARKLLSIQVTCGDFDVTTKLAFHQRNSPKNYMSWKKEELSPAVEPMKAVIELLQKELGETVPPITNHFFIWLCYFFPDKSNLLGENRLSFKDAARNTKPIHASVQTDIDQFQNVQQIETNVQKLVSGWESNENQNPKYSKMIVETIHLLHRRLETKILERLQQDASRFYEIANYYDLMILPRQCLLDLVLRTSLEASTYKPPSIANKHVESRVFFRCFGGEVMKVCGSIHGDGGPMPYWDKLELEFTLPDGKIINMEAPLEIETLSPVTELLKGGVNRAEHIPEISNFLTAVYFLYALEFSEAKDIAFSSFDRLIPISRYPESEEEQYSSDYYERDYESEEEEEEQYSTDYSDFSERW